MALFVPQIQSIATFLSRNFRPQKTYLMKTSQRRVKPEKERIITDLKLVPLPIRNIATKNLPGPTSTRNLMAAIAEITEFKPQLIQPYLRLSAAKTMDGNKGYINAIGCRTMYPGNPSINFVPHPDDFSGKIELWMTNVEEGDSFAISFRVMCAYPGQWKLSSSETAHQFINIAPVFQSVDFFIPAIKNDFGMALIIIEPEFSNYGSWTFTDVTVRRVSFG